AIFPVSSLRGRPPQSISTECVLNILIFFHGFTKEGRPKTQKPCARWREAGLEARSASGDPAMVLMFRMASILSGLTGTMPVASSGRIAAGRLWRITTIETVTGPRGHAKTRAGG